MCQIEEEELTREKWDILVKMVRERDGFFYVNDITPKIEGYAGGFFEIAWNKLHRSKQDSTWETLGPGECYALLAAYEELAGVIAEQARTTCYSYSDFFLYGLPEDEI